MSSYVPSPFKPSKRPRQPYNVKGPEVKPKGAPGADAQWSPPSMSTSLLLFPSVDKSVKVPGFGPQPVFGSIVEKSNVPWYTAVNLPRPGMLAVPTPIASMHKSVGPQK